MTNLVMFTYSSNLSCAYCFQAVFVGSPRRIPIRFDLEGMKRATLEVVRATNNNEVVLHGGEPLLTPIDVLEEYIDWCYQNGIKVSVQTNGSLVREEHIELFKKYGVMAGVSIDGPPELNTARGFFMGDREYAPEASKRYRERLMQVIERLAKERILAGVIVIIHRMNAGDREKLVEFIKWVDSLGVAGRLNHMYANAEFMKKFALTNDELFETYKYIYETIPLIAPKWTPYHDILSELLGGGPSICWFKGCNYYDSHVRIVNPEGAVMSCDRAMDRSEMIARLGLRYKILEVVKRYEGFAHKHEAPSDPSEAMYFGAACKSDKDLAEFEQAYRRGDHDKQGELLGYPKCDREYFVKRWAQGHYDMVYVVAADTEGFNGEEVDVDPLMNIALRYAGIRVLNFFPHSYKCKHAMRFAEVMLETMKKADAEATSVALELLSKEVIWSQVGGVIEVVTPDLFIVAGGYSVDELWVRLKPSRSYEELVREYGLPRKG